MILVITVLLTTYFGFKSRKRKGTWWQRYGPTVLMALAVPLLMADLTRHELQDLGIWTGPSSNMYRPHCKVRGLNALLYNCLTPTGWFFTIFCTWSGFLCLVVATMWEVDLVGKIRRAWRDIDAIRAHRAAAAAEREPLVPVEANQV